MEISVSYQGRLPGYHYVTVHPPVPTDCKEDIPSPQHDLFSENYLFPSDTYIEENTEYIGFPIDFYKSEGAENIFDYAKRVAKSLGSAGLSEFVEDELIERTRTSSRAYRR